ncbi:TonB-dependent receptor [Nannocystis punicea]|uniref:TonB-dependent receptor n=1 Tax=Nannocystis punicea TaxID=2995304 RepID=A0ABY7H4J5_9BACT|nr:TonB-dependent receptor [Nannocystis poenicansa]WAS94010.1 TonB-dependent receptor [Nannocystis poenicansa]
MVFPLRSSWLVVVAVGVLARSAAAAPAPVRKSMPQETSPKGPVPEGPSAPAATTPSAPTKLTREAAEQARTVGRTTVRGARADSSHDTRAASVVTRRDLEERLPRSAPDALRFEPGVYVQQTAHGQGSPYVRGLTGQQTVMMFDGIRLNNSTFRYGPNQYFFTIDSRTLQKLEVLRGASSTRYGSDAMGGALLATPIDPALEAGGPRGWYGHSKAMMRTGTADGEIGGRAQLDVGYKGKVGLFGGVGYRDVGLLRAGGKLLSPSTGQPVKSPLFAADGVTQRGTGFREFTADARLVYQVNDKHRLTLGYYDYRQFDAPRTDRCPPVTAPQSECLTYDEQFRTLVYGAYDVQDGPAAAETVRWTVSYQHQHERRRFDRGADSTYRIIGRDEVYSLGTGLNIGTKNFRLARGVDLKVNYGLDAYFDTLRSQAWNTFLDVGITTPTTSQYASGSRYLTSGVWTEATLRLFDRVELRAGGRGSLVVAKAPGNLDPMVGRRPIDQTWGGGVAGGGVAVRLLDGVRWITNLDQGFRAPNLDDLTSRQATGAGQQYENPNLRPERALSLETGFKIERPRIELQLFAFQSWIDRLITRVRFDRDQCPPDDNICGAAIYNVTLANIAGTSHIRGVDGAVRLFLPKGFGMRATAAYTWGDGPNPVAGLDPVRVPLSRIPPLNGTVEINWRHRLGLFASTALRWARPQTRLTETDKNDQRIPLGGTPGFAVLDLRAGYRLQPHALVVLVLENVTNAAYRYHGSSINGPGRGLNVLIEVGF